MRPVKLIMATLVFSGAAVLAQNKKGEPVKKDVAIAAAQPAAAAPATPVSAPTAEFSMYGTLGFAYAEGTYVFTAGGPKFGVKLGDFGFYMGFFPSLIYSDAYRNFSSAATPVRPNLGVGPEISFRKISIIAPVYYMPRDSYHYTLGIAYKFS